MQRSKSQVTKSKGAKSQGSNQATEAEKEVVSDLAANAEGVESKPSSSKQPLADKSAIAGKKSQPKDIASAKTPADISVEVVKTLAVDIGGSGIKALVLDGEGTPLGERDRIKTPKPATPKAVMAVIEKLAGQQGDFDRVSVGFPGVVRNGVVYTAVNLHPDWVDYDLAGILAKRVQRPVRVANDADLQGMGAISGEGVEMVITLGTGFGTALFTDGHLVANLEFGHQRFRKGQTYEEQLGRAALKDVGQKTWNNRLLKAIDALSRGFNYDRLYLGGGEVKQIKVELPENVIVVSNVLGLLGGINLWK